MRKEDKMREDKESRQVSVSHDRCQSDNFTETQFSIC